MSSIPMLDWLGGYQKGWLCLDLVAGLTTAAVVVPKAMAYATLPGCRSRSGSTPPSSPWLSTRSRGTSRPLSVSTSTTLAILTGFKAGVGLVIVLDQVPKLLGIHFEKGSFLQNLLALIQYIPETSLATLAVGVAMLVILVGIERVAPRAPAPLIAVAFGIAASGLFAL